MYSYQCHFWCLYIFDIHATATPQFPEVPTQAAGKAVEAMISLGAQLVLGMFLGVLKPQIQIATVSYPYLGITTILHYYIILPVTPDIMT